MNIFAKNETKAATLSHLVDSSGSYRCKTPCKGLSCCALYRLNRSHGEPGQAGFLLRSFSFFRFAEALQDDKLGFASLTPASGSSCQRSLRGQSPARPGARACFMRLIPAWQRCEQKSIKCCHNAVRMTALCLFANRNHFFADSEDAAPGAQFITAAELLPAFWWCLAIGSSGHRVIGSSEEKTQCLVESNTVYLNFDYLTNIIVQHK